ncbi:site-specific integrase [Clostridium carnis]
MQGSVRKKGNRWYYRFYEGTRQIEKVGGNTKKEALQALNEELNRQFKGFERPTEMLLSDYLEMWLEDYIKDERAKNTYDKYKGAIHNRINPAIGTIKLCDLKVVHIERFLKTLKKSTFGNGKKLSNTSIQMYYTTLNVALNKAVKLQMLIDNPCRFIDTPKRGKFKANILTLEEYKKIYNSLDDSNYEDYIFKLALDITLETGFRRGEMCGLTWNDIDLKNKTITLKQALIRIKNNYVLSDLKTESSYRTLPISDTLIEKIRVYKTFQNKQKLRYGEFYIKNLWNGVQYDLVLTWENGRFIIPSNFLQRLKRVCKYNGINKNIRWHDLRHTNATLLLEGGAQMKVIQERLGHSLMQTTSDLYVHVSEKINREATNLITSLLNN